MARDQAYREAEWKIEGERHRSGINEFYLRNMRLTEIPETIGQLVHLEKLDIGGDYYSKEMNNRLTALPPSIGNLRQLKWLDVSNNLLADLPDSLVQLKQLIKLNLDGNPLNPELAAAYKHGIDAVKAYLRAKAEAQIILNQAKLILIGEGEVGKTCLLSALRDDKWVEGLSITHGIQIKPIKLTNSDTQKEITLNGWDFGGQRVYRPTHQLFFSAPAVYLVVWKPREGPQQGFVK